MDITFSGAPNPREELSRIISQIEESGDGTLTIVGEHVVDGTINERITNLIVDYGDTGQLILAEGLSVPVWELRPVIPYTGRLRMVRPRIDCSRGQQIGGSSSSTAISASVYERLEIEECDLFGGTRSDRKSDSGIAPVGIVSGLIKGGRIRGFHDLGVYVTGGYTTGNPELVWHDEEMLIDGVRIEDCSGAVDSKRFYKHVIVRNCDVVNCGVAYRMSWVGNVHGGVDGPDIGPGLRMDIIGGIVKNTSPAFRPEGPAVINADGVKLTGVERAVINQGGTVSGKCIAENCDPIVINQTLERGGTVYHPTTTLVIKTKKAARKSKRKPKS